VPVLRAPQLSGTAIKIDPVIHSQGYSSPSLFYQLVFPPFSERLIRPRYHVNPQQKGVLKDVAEFHLLMSLQGDSSPLLTTRMSDVRISISINITDAHSTAAKKSLTGSGGHARVLPRKRHPFSESYYMGANRVVIE